MDEEKYDALINEIQSIKKIEAKHEEELKLLRKDLKKHSKRYEQLVIGVKFSVDEKFRTFKSDFDDRMYEIMLVIQKEIKEIKKVIETMIRDILK